MKDQTQSPRKGFAFYSFLGGMALIAVVWLVATVVTGLTSSRSAGLQSSIPTSPSYSGSGKTAYDSSNSVIGNITQERKATSNYLSVHVKNVQSFHNDMTAFVESVQGKIMNEYITVSSDDQSESGTLQVLVPNKEADNFFNLVGQRAIKVVDRQVNSYTITQEYTDISRQLARYEETYTKILEYYRKAKTVDELLRLQTQLDQVQSSIDALKGRKTALDTLSENTQYTLYSSTNEFNLPYVPQGTFEFAKTFKLAVRALISFTDKILVGLIYVVVFVPVIVVLVLFAWGAKKLLNRYYKA